MRKIEIKTKDVEKLTKKEINFMNQSRIKEYGNQEKIDFKKEDKNAKFFFVKDKKRIMAFGMVKPVEIEYLGKKYKSLAMGRGLAIKKGKGYGKALGIARLQYSKKNKQSILAFTSRKNLEFFKKAGFKVSKNLIRKFRYKNPKTNKIIIDFDGDGVYYDGKNNLIERIIKNKSLACINVPFW